MSQKNSLMEWLEQTKRISKEEDYMGLEIIDTVIQNLGLIRPEIIRRHRRFFNHLCDAYHKPNPVLMLSDNHFDKHFRSTHDGLTLHQWQKTYCRRPEKYPSGGCRAFRMMKDALTDQIEIQIERFKKAQDVITWQWFEIIDFMYERPELVNPSMLDEYITNRINSVCDDQKKNNPLKNGILHRFGKFWRDSSGKWHKERRKRM